MIFRKSERKKLPTVIGLTMGALAVIGFMSIKTKGKEMMSCVAAKMKSMLHKNGSSECTDCTCE